MRRVLIDGTRRRQALRRGGGQPPADIDELDLFAPPDSDDRLLAVDGQKLGWTDSVRSAG